jgi:hypothetical protein
MGYVVGVVLALVVAAFARIAGFDRDRSFYPTVLIVVASYYVLFAVMGGSPRALVGELMVMGLFVALAVGGLTWSAWMVAAGLAGHGLFDFVHASVVSNPGVPEFWPAFCGAYDVTAGALLAYISRHRRSYLPSGLRSTFEFRALL